MCGSISDNIHVKVEEFIENDALNNEITCGGVILLDSKL